MKRTHPISIALAACTAALAPGESSQVVRLFPAGAFRARDGRPQNAAAWRIDRDIAARVIARAAAKADDCVIDYEHQTLHAEKNGQPAPAAGWFKTLEWREGDGLYATDVRWSARAKTSIDAGEYRYFSPVFHYHPKTGEVLDVLMAAVTNYAAVDGLTDLVSRAAARFSFDPEEEDTTVKEELIKLLGLKEGASEQEIQQAVVALKAKVDESATQLQTANTEIAALKAKTGADAEPDPEKYVPVKVVTELQGQIAALSGQVVGREVDELVGQAIKDGKLLPAMESWARDLGKKDVAALKSYITAAVPVAALKGTQTGGKGPEGGADGDLGEEALAVCRQMGVDPAEYKKNLPAAH